MCPNYRANNCIIECYHGLINRTLSIMNEQPLINKHYVYRVALLDAIVSSGILVITVIFIGRYFTKWSVESRDDIHAKILLAILAYQLLFLLKYLLLLKEKITPQKVKLFYILLFPNLLPLLLFLMWFFLFILHFNY